MPLNSALLSLSLSLIFVKLVISYSSGLLGGREWKLSRRQNMSVLDCNVVKWSFWNRRGL
jgi:hypothetical protein